MTVLASRGAYTCVRCELRQALLGQGRRGGAVPAFLAGHRRYETTVAQSARIETGSEPQKSLDEKEPLKHGSTIYRKLKFKPGVAGRNGRRHLERSEHLKIKSLDKETEVIILRDLPQFMGPPRRRLPKNAQRSDEGKDAEAIAQDIHKSLSDTAPLSQDEIVAAMETFRPEELLLDKASYDKLVTDISGSFVKAQVLFFLRKRLPRSAPSKTNVSDLTPEERQDRHPITIVESTQWRPRKSSKGSPATADLSVSGGKLETLSKSALIDRLLKEVWNIRTTSEQEVMGKIEMKLSRQQWALLNTRDDDHLFVALRDEKFFQRSRFDRDPKTDRLVIRGPRSEAEQIAALIQAAFKNATCFDILPPSLHVPQETLAKADISSHSFRSQCQEIMLMTKTSIYVDETASLVRIAAFKQAALDDAVRIVTMLFDQPRNQISRTSTLPESDLLGWEPMNASKGLPSYARGGSYERHVLQGMRHRESGTSVQRQWEKAFNTEACMSATLKALQAAEDHFDQYHAQRSIIANDSAATSCWETQVAPLSWTARFGHLLVDRGQEGIAEQEPFSESGRPGARQCFSHKIPTMHSVLSQFERVIQADLGDRSAMDDRLVAKLIPSPFDASESQRSAVLPEIDVIFRVSQKDAAGELEAASNDNAAEVYRYPLQGDSELVLDSIQASLADYQIYQPMPHRPVDVQLSAAATLHAKLPDMMARPEVKKYVESMASSMQQGAQMRAPATVSMPICGLMTGSTGQGVEDTSSQATYFFAGFEHRQTRRLKPVELSSSLYDEADGTGHWSFSDVEGGVSGGRRSELAVQGQGSDLSRLLKRAFYLADLCHVVATEHTEPLSKEQAAAALSRLQSLENVSDSSNHADSSDGLDVAYKTIKFDT